MTGSTKGHRAGNAVASRAVARDAPAADAVGRDGGRAPHDDGGAEAKERLFWSLAEPLLALPTVARGTMMGFPCLRVEGRFFASIDRSSRDLVIKLPAERVAELVADGGGSVFAPNNRVFREWVAIPTPDPETWEALLHEAFAFAEA